MHRKRVGTFVVFVAVTGCLLVADCRIAAQVKKTPAVSPKSAKVPEKLPLLKKDDFEYLGAFRLPGPDSGKQTFAYGGTALAFNPLNESLFLVGHDHHQEVAEVSIPKTLTKSERVADLPEAAILQPLKGILGRLPRWTLDGNVKIGGLMVVDKKLIGTAYVYYDGPGKAVDSHFMLESTDLNSEARGLFQVGRLGAGFVAGYMAPVPPEWQKKIGAPYLTGQAALAIISRTSSGPAVFGFDPKNLGKTPAPVHNLVHYPLKNPLGKIDTKNPYYNGMTTIRGVVFPPHTRSVLFFGTHNNGTADYKPGGWVLRDGRTFFQVWAYDANHLLAVKKGAAPPWRVRPYDVWEMPLPITTPNMILGGAALDPATRRVFVSQQFGNGVLPLIHVFGIRG
ncbi:MAG: hypothetical protein L0Y71_10550 [Gemmataceae bacterium]|nr:hypothetical protein [Gemmataceae bacterium]